MSVTTIQCDSIFSIDQGTQEWAHEEGKAPTEEIEIRMAARVVRSATSATRVRILCGADIEPEIRR
jgi:hypothetical protein